MRRILLIDFGSTYTKATCVDADAAEILATGASYTTVEQDVGLGLSRALDQIAAKIGDAPYCARYACSSAAGGLRMAASGLVPALTAEAAKRAALGAGAKVTRVFSYQLTEDDAEEIRRIRPDIFLLTGGTDGGNSECILHNAAVLAGMRPGFPVVLAGNRTCARASEKLLSDAGVETHVAENVMPTFNKLNIEPAQGIIREIFLSRIVRAKGLSRQTSLLDGILMPTPAAVMDALELLSEISGELVAVDLGGATTDVYSVTQGLPTRGGTVLRGLPEPYAKRTVEGDIGMRYGAHGIVEAVGAERVAQVAGVTTDDVEEWLALISVATDTLPRTERQRSIDFALASLAIEIGLVRHAGTIEQVFTPMGVAYQQTGKDLTRATRLVLTGGALIHAEDCERMAKRAMETDRAPSSLMPRSAAPVLDRHYILSAMGLLRKDYPDAAREILRREFP